jgi:carbonic anhydrase/acetyltransferase-like protein (isoleucine patch superfamily)
VPIMKHRGVGPRIHPTASVAGGAWVIGDVEVGARSSVQDGCAVHVTNPLPAIVGDDVTIGHKAVIHGCTIADGLRIGMNAVVLDNGRVGPFAVVAAGSVVKEHVVVPERTLAAGVPARIVRNSRRKSADFFSSRPKTT